MRRSRRRINTKRILRKKNSLRRSKRYSKKNIRKKINTKKRNTKKRNTKRKNTRKRISRRRIVGGGGGGVRGDYVVPYDDPVADDVDAAEQQPPLAAALAMARMRERSAAARVSAPTAAPPDGAESSTLPDTVEPPAPPDAAETFAPAIEVLPVAKGEVESQALSHVVGEVEPPETFVPGTAVDPSQQGPIKHPNSEVQNFLKEAGLGKFAQLFIDIGIGDMEDLKEYSAVVNDIDTKMRQPGNNITEVVFARIKRHLKMIPGSHYGVFNTGL